MSLPGYTAADTLALAAAFLSAKVANSDIDWDKAMVLMGSRTVAGARERVRVAKKKSPAESAAPVGGVDKKATGKVKGGATPAISTKATKIPKTKIKKDPSLSEESAGADSMEEEV